MSKIRTIATCIKTGTKHKIKVLSDLTLSVHIDGQVDEQASAELTQELQDLKKRGRSTRSAVLQTITPATLNRYFSDE